MNVGRSTLNEGKQMKNIVVIGATGDVGAGIVTELLKSGHRVVASSRGAAKLDALKSTLATHGRLEAVAGSVASESEARALLEGVRRCVDRIDAVVSCFNMPITNMPLLQRSADDLADELKGNLVAHFAAAKVFIPAVAQGGIYLAIGGGKADIIVPGSGVMAICQAGQRNMFRMIARENRGGPVLIRELILYSTIAGASNRDKAEPSWITAEEAGRHVLAVLADPATFAGPILALKSRAQVGSPEEPAK